MKSVGSYEAKTHLPALLARVAKGEKIVITKRGQPVAMLVPPEDKPKMDVVKVIEKMKAYRKKQKRTLDGISIRELINEGRRF